jgi:hypothetical protein
MAKLKVRLYSFSLGAGFLSHIAGTLYEDEGDGFGYQNDVYCLLKFVAHQNGMTCEFFSEDYFVLIL